jgi:hypothetical protein
MPSFVGATLLAMASCAALATAAEDVAAPWRSLFDGESLQGWKPTNFGGEGTVIVEEGALQLGFGSSLTGITFTGDFPRRDYEVQLEAMRVDGIDFFCGLTFPVDQDHCSFIVGGWAGSVVGLSSIDGKDASENETTRYLTFDSGRWYQIRLRVTAESIQAGIDGPQVVHQPLAGRRRSIRVVVCPTRP